jgi:hypothetical protein
MTRKIGEDNSAERWSFSPRIVEDEDPRDDHKQDLRIGEPFEKKEIHGGRGLVGIPCLFRLQIQ